MPEGQSGRCDLPRGRPRRYPWTGAGSQPPAPHEHLSARSTDDAAGSARRPTERTDRYLIPVDHVPAELAARVSDPEAVAPTRPAATVVIAREGDGGPEVLLVRRPARSAFAANAWVFPGGRVDPEDAVAAASMLGPSAAAWGARLGLPAREAAGFVAAALREAWEETGILVCDLAPHPDRAREARERVLREAGALPGLLSELGVRLDARNVAYIAHWITPEPEPRRYDTRFFLAAALPGATCELVGDELEEARWISPGHAVAAYREGELRLLPPTVHTLDRLAAFGSVPEMMEALRDAAVPTILPRMRLDPAGVVIEIPE